MKKPLKELKQEMQVFTLGVHPITMREFFCMDYAAGNPLKTMKRLLKKGLLNIMNGVPPPKEYYQDKPLHTLAPPDSLLLQEAVRINWELPDATLIEHFKQFLKSNRPKQTLLKENDENSYLVKKFNRKLNFKEWCRLSILPYLDLQLWSLENNLSIPYRVMADAIYPPGQNGEETVRKTTAPLADMLMSHTTLNALAHKAALEIAERNSR